MSEGVLIYGKGTKRKARDLQSFADVVLDRKRNNGSYFVIDKVDGRIIRNLKERGIDVKSTKAVITDETVRKYKDHAKREKGAAVSLKRFAMVEHAVKHPKNVYIDKNRDRLVYVSATGYNSKKVIKVILEPNQRFKKKYFFNVVSIGVVKKVDMDKQPQYEKIK